MGATPNEIKSDRESSSFPNSLVLSSILATFPSNLSVNAATITSKDAWISSPLKQKSKAIIPSDRFINVNRFGNECLILFFNESTLYF